MRSIRVRPAASSRCGVSPPPGRTLASAAVNVRVTLPSRYGSNTCLSNGVIERVSKAARVDMIDMVLRQLPHGRIRVPHRYWVADDAHGCEVV